MQRVRGLAFGLVIVALTIGVIAGVVTGIRHIPRPAKKIEWVQSDASIIVQMKANGFQGVAANGIDSQLIVPEFTLYGDGTLIASKSGGKCPCQLITAKLSAGDVRDLLRFIDDTGFFDYSYVEPGGVSVGPTTYVYAAIKNSQNIAGAHFLLSSSFLGVSVEEPVHYRKLQEIWARLRDVIKKASLDGSARDYLADEIILTAKFTRPTIRSTPPEWPLPQIDLASVAGESGIGNRRINGDLARGLQQALATHPFESDYLQNGQSFGAGYHPVLPHEDNFPEFEPPAAQTP